MQVERVHAEEMIAHVQAGAPNEACGILAGRDGRTTHVYRARNAENSRVRYSIDPRELLDILRDLDDRGWELAGIFHSHPHSQAYPSLTDVDLAFYPDAVYFIISLVDPDHPELRGFRIVDRRIEEIPVEIV